MLCCMFKSSRATHVRKLWKLRVHHESRGEEENADDIELKSIAHSVLKRLKEKQLESLVQSIELHGSENSQCVMLPRGEIRIGKKVLTPLVLCCRMWRWDNVSPGTDLKRLSCCRGGDDPIYECCNPYHWSLLTEPDCEITSGWSDVVKAKYTVDLDRPPDDPEEAVSMETGMTPTPRQEFSGSTSEDSNEGHHHSNMTSGVDPSLNTGQSSHGPHWCTVAYWELRERVGRLRTVFDKTYNIFQSLPLADGLCLDLLQSEPESDSIRRTREKIGFGVVLSKEGDGVWIYNRSQFPIFVNSPTLENPKTRTLYVHKVMPGYSLKIFDYTRAHLIVETCDPKVLDGPYDPNSIRVSFAKGWGRHYSRQFVTSCPCWLEIMLNITEGR
ncbi:mothers against decapentaplegic homolog 6-like [Mya arenaria]|uniref:mothers against decapentaplegic homolog 6-like n=1 Tax=Mya arenaria TaxID=6604 RepID=UPI0022E7DC74|nr:mothers against decapentaplegic homolog 6-like [Mya arenaria]